MSHSLVLKLLSITLVLFYLFSFVRSDPQNEPFDEFEEEDFETQFESIEEYKNKKSNKVVSENPTQTKESHESTTQKVQYRKSAQPLEEEEEFEDFGEDFYVVEPKKQAPKEEKRKRPPPQEHFYFEMFYLFLLVSYLINYYIGKNQNQKIALSWIVTFEEFLKKNFTQVGGGGVLLAKESYNVFTLTARGRINCMGLQVTLDLIKRQDLFALMYAYLTGATDKMTVDIPLTEGMESFIFLLIRKRIDKSYQKEALDVKDFCENVSHPTIPKTFVISSDSPEVVDDILTNEVIVTITGSESYLQLIHITDQSPFNQTHKKSLRAVFTLPDHNNMESIDLLFKMTFFIVDLLPSISLSKIAKEKAQKRRLQLVKQAEKLTHQQRQEAAQQRKIEKIQKEKEKVATLSPEAQLKYEEKEQRKQMRKRQMKFKVYQ